MFNHTKPTITFLILINCTIISTCDSSQTGNNSDYYDTIEETKEVIEDTYAEDCYRTQWWFCPPHNAVWQKEVVVDTCVDPPDIISMGECIEYFECDPSIFLQGEHGCTTNDGYPGNQKYYCNKGYYEYGKCISPCEEEICDYKDNDCDGAIDEGQRNVCDECGAVPADVCDGIDNDCDDAIDEDLVQECFTACGIGLEYCEEGGWISCTAQQPAPEVCDGIDNDCDGSIDEDIQCSCTIDQVGSLFPCEEPPLLCGQGFRSCICAGGDCTKLEVTPCFATCYFIPQPGVACDPLVGMALEDETCNNFDDNCNSLIDEDLTSGCYTGPDGTLNVGICEPGSAVCKAGVWGNKKDGVFQPGYCTGEVLPEPKDSCNGVDEDCDGEADEGKALVDTDILFIVDRSGSMSNDISAVIQALGMFAAYYSDESIILWGLIDGPATPQGTETLYLTSDLSPFSDFSSKLGATMLGNYGSSEMLLDAIYISLVGISSATKDTHSWTEGTGSSPPLKDFSISWRTDSNKVIIVFTDEDPQTFLIPSIIPNQIIQAANSVQNLKIYVFTTNFTKGGWSPIATNTGGSWYPLALNPTTMYESLVEILDENICE